jgi:hypothetical protein
MNIEEHIALLLANQVSVTLPAIGIIKPEIVHSQIHPVQHQFAPPLLQFQFINNPNQTDSILYNTLIESGEYINIEATRLIKEYCNHIQIELNRKGAFEIKGVGKLFFDVERKLQFTSMSTNNYLYSSFGLPEFISFPVLRKENISSYAVTIPKPEKKKKKINWFKF